MPTDLLKAYYVQDIKGTLGLISFHYTSMPLCFLPWKPNLQLSLFLFVSVERIGVAGKKAKSTGILRAVISPSGVLCCQFPFSEWVISVSLHSSQHCSALHILHAQWILVNCFYTSKWQHKYIMKKWRAWALKELGVFFFKKEHQS